ncbi:MAG: alpha/beta fold hydrolase [Kofleriaceae bacterium]
MQNIVDRYLATWNETDPTRRAALLAQTFTPDARYVDPLAAVAGHDQLSALIGAVQAKFPGLAFTQRGGVDTHNNLARFSWSLGPAGGTDIVTLDGDRIANVVGFLDHVPTTPKSPFVTTRDGEQLFVTDTGGTGMPIVFVASSSLPGTMWKFQVPAFRAAGLRCITFDRRGHGRSTPATSGFDLETLADDLDSVMTSLDLRGAMLVAHSMGGAEVVRYLAKHGTTRVAKVALIAPTTPSVPRTPDITKLLHAQLSTNYAKWVADNKAAFFATDAMPEMLDWIATEILAIAPDAAIQMDDTIVAANLQEDCRAIDKPTLIIHGDLDASVPLDCAKRTAAAIRGARLSIYDGAAHGVFLTHLDRVNAELIAFAHA